MVAFYRLKTCRVWFILLQVEIRSPWRAGLAKVVVQRQAKAGGLPPGRHPITSRRVQEGYNGSDENRNWYLATGGYVRWGTGTVEVLEGGGNRSYSLDFEYHVYDRYNWDTGKSVTILGVTVTDAFMGDFHRQGLAREFDMRGSVKKTIKWKKGQAPKVTDRWESEGGR